MKGGVFTASCVVFLLLTSASISRSDCTLINVEKTSLFTYLDGRWEGMWYSDKPWINGPTTLFLNRNHDGFSLTGVFQQLGGSISQFEMIGQLEKGGYLLFRNEAWIVHLAIHGSPDNIMALSGEYESISGPLTSKRGAYELIKKSPTNVGTKPFCEKSPEVIISMGIN